MANTIVGNVIIVDSGSINLEFPGNGNSAKIRALAWWGSNTTGLFELSHQASTANIIFKLQSPINDPSTIYLNLAEGVYFDKLYVNTVTAGTGWLYLA